MEDFEICESDDEWNVYKIPDKIVDIPVRFVPIFKEIDEKKFLNLTCLCPRKGNLKEKQLSPATSAVVSPTQPLERITDKELTDQTKTFEAFDFDNDDGHEKPLAKRQKTAVSSVKREKKVASMENVMSDLLRSKFLDEQETITADNTISATNDKQ